MAGHDVHGYWIWRERRTNKARGGNYENIMAPHGTCVIFSPPAPGALSLTWGHQGSTTWLWLGVEVACTVTGSVLLQELMVTFISCRTSSSRGFQAARWGIWRDTEESSFGRENTARSVETGRPCSNPPSWAAQTLTNTGTLSLRLLQKLVL